MTSATMGEMDGLKAQLKSIWAAGGNDRFSRCMEGGAREFYQRLNIASGFQSLDIACGSGQLALMPAKDGIEVIGVDIARNMVERARAGAQADRLNACFEETDAEVHSFDDASVEVVVSLTSEVVEVFCLSYGPITRAVASLDDEGQARLRQELETLWAAHHQSGVDCTTVFAKYLEVVGNRG